MEFRDTIIADVKLVVPRKFADDRGDFAETYKKAAFREHGIAADFIQDNRARSIRRHTVRGLHFQIPPFAQAKLVSVQAGRIFDVAVDLRRGSPTFGRWVAAELTAEGGEQIFVPAGFAHGYCTLETDCVVTYKVDSIYAPAHERGLHWQSPDLRIAWPCAPESAFVAPKDAALPMTLAGLECFA